uniref:Structure-specific endonuclease subunit SLX4 n=1 Tax=Gasterosteus aculeatus aculeatus TaxID=481459 RepID=A0AAQ4QZH4_GASAC
MDDSDQDFVDLCSKLLKRVRKKPGESIQPRRNHRREPEEEEEVVVVGGGTDRDSGDARSSVAASAGPRGSPARDKVLHRMQQFKRASPRRMVHGDKSPTAVPEKDGVPPPPPRQAQGLHPEPGDSDEALALRLQQQLDREAAEARTADLEGRGLFFCQICHRALSHMTPEGRTQHLNRCLDDSEDSAPAPPPPPPVVSDCPICGRKFKSQKSRLAHLKRCSSDMGVAPAVLLQALQRQTEETQNVPTDHTLAQTGGTKRKGPPKPGLPTRKKPRKKDAPLDEDTMVALALSTSLLEQEKQSETNTAASHTSMTASLKWRPDKGKSRGKRRKGGDLRPPPLLLVQDAAAALTRLQERVSALLLCSRGPSPPTPPRRPSSLPGRSAAAVLWQKSALLGGGAPTCPSDFYTPELRDFIAPWESAATEAAANNPPASVQPVREGTPVPCSMASILSSSSQASTSQTAPSTSRALLMDLMELAEDGVTLTQCGRAASGPDGDGSAGQIANVHLSRFVVVEESEEQTDLRASGFLPEPTRNTHSQGARWPARRTTAGRGGADEEWGSPRSVALSGLASDLSSMVNNPQLSDLQLQVDSGEVFFAHSFMLYARCPLLAEMAHGSGFGVREEGEPATQRVLLNDVSGQAVLALLQYLYAARCSVPAALRAHVLELASRFDLQELQSLCEQDPDEGDRVDQEETVADHTHQALAELLRSMWDEEDEDGEGMDAGGERDEERELGEDHQGDDLASGDRESREEKVNEEELEEIYEFAATQRKREEEKDGTEEEEEEKADEEEDGKEVPAKLTEPKRSPSGVRLTQLQPNPQLEPDRSSSRLFSDSWGVYGEEDPSTAAPAERHSPRRRGPSEPSSEPSLLRSSASAVHGLSISPPPDAPNMPVPGRSPGQAGERVAVADEVTGDVASKRERSGARSICVPQGEKEPELIVLSDSSEELELVLSSRSPSPRPHRASRKLRSYTLIKPQPIPDHNAPPPPNTLSVGLEFGPGDPVPDQSESGTWCDQNPVDCSPEVSWLIPSTPVQPGRSTTTSSTQTKSSMCRTQLFPEGDTSVVSPPALPVNERAQTSPGPGSVSAPVGPIGGGVRKSMPEETCRSSLDLSLRSGRPGGVREDRAARAPPPCRPTPLHVLPRPYSSTPLHAELHEAPAPPATSPLLADLDQSWTCQAKDRAPSERRKETELRSFRLSPLSAPTQPPSSPSHRALRGTPRRSQSPRPSRRPVECSGHNHAGSALAGNNEGEAKDSGADEGRQEEADVGESSFQQSFMDEPPIAFNDSWGFDAADLGANPGRFSLALEDSGASSQRGERGESSLVPRGAARTSSSSSTDQQPSPRSPVNRRHGAATASAPSEAHRSPAASGVAARGGLSFTPSPPEPPNQAAHGVVSSLLDSKIWDSWEEEDDEDLPLCQRVNPSSAQLKTPASSRNQRRATLVPITPLPHYSDMDTPELKNKLNRFGVRPLPKRQMILKLKEIHQYTHQLVSSEEEEEAPSASCAALTRPPATGPEFRPASCSQRVTFKAPEAVATEEAELLSASQGSNSSSGAASGESESRSNPELCLSSDSDSDEGVSASQSANRLKESLRAVRAFILSNAELYGQILKYQPLVLSRLQQQLKAAGIRLGAAKLVDYLDSQCITFTTAKPGRAAPGRGRGKKTGRGAKAAGRKRAATAVI